MRKTLHTQGGPLLRMNGMPTSIRPRPRPRPQSRADAEPQSRPSAGYQNFLFLTPSTAEDRTHDVVLTMAKQLTAKGYVYVARPNQSQIEDDKFGIRHLPLHGDRLPSFGMLTAAFVVGDSALATVAAVEYAPAEVFLIERSGDCIRTHRLPAAATAGEVDERPRNGSAAPVQRSNQRPARRAATAHPL